MNILELAVLKVDRFLNFLFLILNDCYLFYFYTYGKQGGNVYFKTSKVD